MRVCTAVRASVRKGCTTTAADFTPAFGSAFERRRSCFCPLRSPLSLSLTHSRSSTPALTPAFSTRRLCNIDNFFRLQDSSTCFELGRTTAAKLENCASNTGRKHTPDLRSWRRTCSRSEKLRLGTHIAQMMDKSQPSPACQIVRVCLW